MKQSTEKSSAWQPRTLLEKIEDLVVRVFTDKKIDWGFRNFKRVLLADNPFLKTAEKEFFQETFDLVEFGSSPLETDRIYHANEVKFTNAIREVKPEFFLRYDVVQKEAMGIPPQLETLVEAIHKSLTADYETQKQSIKDEVSRISEKFQINPLNPTLQSNDKDKGFSKGLGF